jgi:hypothetical protein
MIKEVLKKEEYYIQFTDEEMEQLGFNPNTKFTVELNEDKTGLKLTPHEEIEIDLEEFSKEELINIIVAANKVDMTFEEFLVDSLTKFCEAYVEKK